jgi:hypothetical protein
VSNLYKISFENPGGIYLFGELGIDGKYLMLKLILKK